MLKSVQEPKSSVQPSSFVTQQRGSNASSLSTAPSSGSNQGYLTQLSARINGGPSVQATTQLKARIDAGATVQALSTIAGRSGAVQRKADGVDAEAARRMEDEKQTAQMMPASFAAVAGNAAPIEEEKVAQTKPVASAGASVAQLAIDPKIKTNTRTKYEISAVGAPSEFSGGANAGSGGVGGVESYKAYIHADNQLNILGNKTGKEKGLESETMDNTVQGLAQGHILAKSLGGPGDASNIFAQDAGQNNGGDWKSFEHAARQIVGNAPNDATISFWGELRGSNLTDY